MAGNKETTQIFRDVLSRVDIDELEREQLDYWEKEQIFEQSLELAKKQ